EARRLLERAVDAAPPGPARAAALRVLGGVRAMEESWTVGIGLFRQALDEAGDDRALRGRIEQSLGYADLFMGDLEAAERHARSTLELAEEVGDPAPLAEALQFVGYLEFVLGRGAQWDLFERATALERETEEYWVRTVRPSYTWSQLLKYTDEFDAARSGFHALLQNAEERGEEHPLPALHHHLAELECWAGNWEAAETHAREGLEAAIQTGMAFYRTMALYAAALVDAHRGRVDAARAAATEGLKLAEGAGVVT